MRTSLSSVVTNGDPEDLEKAFLEMETTLLEQAMPHMNKWAFKIQRSRTLVVEDDFIRTAIVELIGIPVIRFGIDVPVNVEKKGRAIEL